MAKFKKVSFTNGTEIIDATGKIDYSNITNVPSSVVDTSSHVHDDRYSSKASVEDRFNSIMNKVQSITKSLTARPLKTKAYLNGGYKSSYVYAERVQRFNATTETGSEIGQIGTVTSQYSPGASSEYHGYFFGDPRNGATSNFNSTGRHVDKIQYSTESESYLGNITTNNADSTAYKLYSQTEIFYCDTGSTWSKIDCSTDTNSLQTSGATAKGIGRQGLSSETFAQVVQSGNGTYMSYKYNYSTKTSQNAMNIAVRQQPAGISKNKDMGYWVDYGTSNNHRVNYLTNTAVIISSFTEGFGESNTLAAETHGFCLGGYDGAQHDKVQKMSWETEVAQSILGGKLAIPQSSAGTAEA
jgi:hypothetical protein